MRKVFEARNHAEAHMLVELLQAEGVPSVVRGDALFTTVEGAAAVPGMCPSVWILAEGDEARCMDLLGRYRRGEALHDPGAQAWQCADCGEPHEPQFRACWKCGAPRPGLPG